MSEKVRVVVCTGTACYVMGGAELLDIESRLPAALAGRIELEGSPCLGLCHDRRNGAAPFAEVDGETVAAATIEGLAEAIGRRLAARGGSGREGL
ncbi:MAG TPA: NAD(P)H-dependent oxidoreductase subunit E [Spirochaetia bacterium]|nr:NAD(P)H-dependent oxidoreductase subunit E [Spirochaetales bacterium]HRY71762.1 NAD(P)H-dependent oxidoreductase subunit E [Spirochaetia bacterium]